MPAAWEAQRARHTLATTIVAKDAVVLVAEDEAGEIVGFCTAYLDLESVRSGLRCWVEDLAVHPARRSQGLGSHLLGAAQAWARRRGATHLELATATERADAQRFYDRERPTARSISYTWEL
jgi:GNAT superfamily N-acetyltransferase